MRGKIAFAGPWIGEFGWEIMTWQSHLRLRSHDYASMIISTFPGMEPLYAGFHCPVMFKPHRHPGRALDWRDVSNVDYDMPDFTSYTKPIEIIEPVQNPGLEGEYIRFGTPKNREFEILFHARGLRKSDFKNYPVDNWQDVANMFQKSASIGTMEDIHIPGTVDKRGIPLQELMDLIASAKTVVGQSSGVMHLASLCGTRHVVWGDNKTYYHKPLEYRYKERWNPFQTPVAWVKADNWDPAVQDVKDAILEGGAGAPIKPVLQALQDATASEEYIVCIAHMAREDKEDTIEVSHHVVNYPDAELEKTNKMLKQAMDNHQESRGTRAEETPLQITGKGVPASWR